MQAPLFEHYGIDGDAFWGEVKDLAQARVNAEESEATKNTLLEGDEIRYLNHILDYVKDGRFKDLSNSKLRELGKGIQFYQGVRDCMASLKEEIAHNKNYKKHEIKLEHYVISAGLRQMILGSEIYDVLDDVWGCEFIEKDGVVDRISYVVDHTTKTRAVFEINKGVNKFPDKITINAMMPEAHRRVPINQMIYVADGPSDVPVFSVLNKADGITVGVYNPESDIAYDKAYRLHKEEERTDYFGAADYTEGTEVRRFLEKAVNKLAEKIVKRMERKLDDVVGQSPEH